MRVPTIQPIREERPLSGDERRLATLMLEHGDPDARAFLPQLERARVVSRCGCGCASIDPEVDGFPHRGGGLRILGDFVHGEGDGASGIFIFERDGILAGLEVYGLAGDAPTSLPDPAALRGL